jgi:hypothetical protein
MLAVCIAGAALFALMLPPTMLAVAGAALFALVIRPITLAVAGTALSLCTDTLIPTGDTSADHAGSGRCRTLCTGPSADHARRNIFCRVLNSTSSVGPYSTWCFRSPGSLDLLFVVRHDNWCI